MKCPECSFENRSDANFCSECGKHFLMTCLDCGSGNRGGSKFCDECGHQLLRNKKKDRHGSLLKSERKNVTVLFSDMSG